MRGGGVRSRVWNGTASWLTASKQGCLLQLAEGWDDGKTGSLDPRMHGYRDLLAVQFDNNETRDRTQFLIRLHWFNEM